MATSTTLRSIVPAIAALVIVGCQSGPAPTSVGTAAAATPGVTLPATAGASMTPQSTPMGLMMSNGRKQGTSTRLPDGSVLVAGGYRGDFANNTADVYEPSIRSFRPTGKLVLGRYWHTATLLSDGRVLLIGGTTSGPVVSAAELWDPATGVFTVAGELPAPRTLHTATPLLDGRVLVVGGLTPNVEPIAEALLWDPRTSAFTPAGSLAHPRAWHSAARLPDGRVVIAGGPAEAEVWDPRTMTFSPAGKLATARWWATATALSDGRVVVIGGFAGEAFDAGAGVVATVEIWDPATSTFAAAGSLARGRAIHAAVLLRDGRIAVIGGSVVPGTAGPLPSASVEIWDPTIRVTGPETIAFTASDPLTVARQGEMATLLGDDTILVAGGSDARGVGLASAELLGPFIP